MTDPTEPAPDAAVIKLFADPEHAAGTAWRWEIWRGAVLFTRGSPHATRAGAALAAAIVRDALASGASVEREPCD